MHGQQYIKISMSVRTYITYVFLHLSLLHFRQLGTEIKCGGKCKFLINYKRKTDVNCRNYLQRITNETKHQLKISPHYLNRK